MKRFMLWGSCVAMLVAAVAMSAGCSASGGAKGPEKGAAGSQPVAESPSSDAAEKVKVAKVGQEVSAGDWKLTVKGVEFVPAAGGATAEQGKELAVVTIDLTNGGSADKGTGPVYFKFAGADGQVIDAAPTGDPEFIFNTPQPIKAGETRTIKIAYPVPAGVKTFQMTFEPFVEGGTTPAVIDIE